MLFIYIFITFDTIPIMEIYCGRPYFFHKCVGVSEWIDCAKEKLARWLRTGDSDKSTVEFSAFNGFVVKIIIGGKFEFRPKLSNNHLYSMWHHQFHKKQASDSFV